MKGGHNKNMKHLGYFVRGENGMPFRRFFPKWGVENSPTDVHVYEQGNPEIERHLKFRNWMGSHEDDRKQYAELKAKLAKEFSNDTIAYCLGKEAFIADIDLKAGFNGMRIVAHYLIESGKPIYVS